MDKYEVTGMSCAACQMHVEKAVSQVKGVVNCNVSLLTNSMVVDGTADEKEIIKAVENAGYGAKKIGGSGSSIGKSASQKLREQEEALRDKETAPMLKRLISSVCVLLILMYFSMGHMMFGFPVPFFLNNHVSLGILQMLLSLIVIFINRKFWAQGFGAVIHGSTNMDTLVALGSTASFGYSLVALFIMVLKMADGNMAAVDDLAMNHIWFESAAMIPTLITIGKTVESYSKGRTTDALKSLMKISPKTAVVIRDGIESVVNIDDVSVNDIFVVKSGDSVPVDGIIVEGRAAVDESAITGESIPVDKSVGDELSAATINRAGFLKAKATRVGEDTTLSQIIKMVSDAAATKAPIARIADKVASVFVPAVILIALLTCVGWMIAGQTFTFAFTRAVSVLVISCPCALGLAVPVAIMVGNGVGAKNGILFKTASSLEATGRIQIIAMDKTGTITKGTPEVNDIVTVENTDRNELLKSAASLEIKSEHPLAKAINEYCRNNHIEPDEVTDFNVLPGSGLYARHGDEEITGGSLDYISGRFSVKDELIKSAGIFAEQGKTPLFFARSGNVLGFITVSDSIKEESRNAISQLRKMGIEVIMLTGDNPRTAKAIGDKAGVDKVIAGVLPDGKEKNIRELQKKGKVAMVGDGINDAPALTRADIGIAIGAGTDVAIDAADVVLMKSRLDDVPSAIRLSRSTIKNIHENLFWAFFYNIICIPLAIGLYQAIFGLGFELKPVVGAVAMSISSVTVCLNALRLNLCNVHDDSHDKPLKPDYSGKGNAEILFDDSNEGFAIKPFEKTLEKPNKTAKIKKTINIEGMMCGHCEKAVGGALGKLDGVVSTIVSFEKGTAIVLMSKEIADDILTKAVEDEDYKVISISE